MASTYSALKIELIATGEQSGVWGNTTNTNLGTALEEAIVGRATADFTTDADLTISLTNTNLTQVARNYILDVTSGVLLTATRNLIVPTINKPYIVENNTTGGQSIIVKTVAGTGVTVPNGKTAMVYANSTNVVSAVSYIPSVTTPSATITGGTVDGTSLGATTPSTAAVTNFSYTGTLTGSTGVLNIGSGQIYKDAAGKVGLGTASPAVSLAVNGIDAMLVPKGATGDRPTGVSGYLRFNTSTGSFEGYNGTAWGSIGGGATGGGGDQTFYLNGQTITTTYSIPAGQNAMSTGPLTINSGVTVTIPSGSRWVVL